MVLSKLWIPLSAILLSSCLPVEEQVGSSSKADHQRIGATRYLIPHLGIEMISVDAGCFSMERTENYLDGTKKVSDTKVTLTYSFWIAKTEVTQKQYKAVMGYNLSHFKETGSSGPVDSVNWKMASDFCEKLTKL